jgi:hypothetical protein
VPDAVGGGEKKPTIIGLECAGTMVIVESRPTVKGGGLMFLPGAIT